MSGMKEITLRLPSPPDPAPAGVSGIEGLWTGIDADGRPLVDWPGKPHEAPQPARFLAHVLDGRRPGHVPLAVWLDVSGGQPLILGLIETRLAPADVTLDGERVVLEAARELELRCGQARIVLTRDGEIVVRGLSITSRAAGSHRIRGASVQIN